MIHTVKGFGIVDKAETDVVHAETGSIKRNSVDLTEAKDIKKRWQEYTEELYKKDLHQITMMV